MNRRDFIASAGLAAAVLCLRFRTIQEAPPQTVTVYVYEYRNGAKGFMVWETPESTPPWEPGRDGFNLVSVKTLERRPFLAGLVGPQVRILSAAEHLNFATA